MTNTNQERIRRAAERQDGAFTIQTIAFEANVSHRMASRHLRILGYERVEAAGNARVSQWRRPT